MGLGLPLDLFDFDQPLIAVAGGSPGRVDGSAEAVEINRIHPAVTQVGIVRNGEQLVTRLALRVHPVPKVLRVP